jgi:hypothetical protein
MPPKLAGRHPRPPPEGPGEVALVGESGGEGDLCKRGVGRCELSASELDPQSADVVARGAFVVPAEGAGEMHRVDADLRGDGAEVDVAREAVAQEVTGAAEPTRGRAPRDGAPVPRRLGQDLQD